MTPIYVRPTMRGSENSPNAPAVRPHTALVTTDCLDRAPALDSDKTRIDAVLRNAT